MTIQNIKTGKTIEVNTGFRKNDKIVKFMGITMKIEGNTFRKHWMIKKAAL